METIRNLVRKNILNLQAYSSARDEYKESTGVFLDANESPFGKLNRYPDPHQLALKTELANNKKVKKEQIFIGNGSDEVIDFLLRVFCTPQQDKVIICPPTYGMYKVSARINDLSIIEIPLTIDFQLNVNAILKQKAKILFLCSPNNPTGNSLNQIATILDNFKGIILLDEAYIDFSEKESWISKLDKYPNLVVSQTFSKAYGLAASRIGVAYSNPEIIAFMNKIKAPYNVSSANQEAAIQCIKNRTVIQANIDLIKQEKARILKELKKNAIVTNIYPSDANFLLVRFQNANKVFETLLKQKIITRNRSSEVNNCIRITIGKPEENDKLLNELKKMTK